MSDILCRWLNQELQLSKAVEPKTIAKDFASGYLMGEVLHKYQLQNDFNMFMKKDTSVSKLNNFTRLEPTLQLLGISFDINTAQDLIQEKQGAATRLLYQLYVSLEKNRKAEISGTMMEIMQPAGCASLHKKEHQIYSDRLRQVVKRDTELKLQKISQHYEEKFQQFVVTPPIEQKRQVKVQDEKRLKNIDKVGQSPIDFSLGSSSQGRDLLGRGNKVMLQSSNRYIQEIRKRLEENAIACKEREKRQDRFLVEQLKVHEAQEEARREEQLVKRLTRQTQQEQRLATQLLQIRMQKEVIRENRLFREQQYQQRRERDFQEALDREAALAQQAKLDRAEEIKKELEFCNRIAVERTQRKYKKHFENCRGILEQIMDLATKVGEYRLLNGNRIPEKLMREWKELLFSGLPLYEPVKDRQPGFGFREPLDTIELQKQEILNNQDYDEYTNMMGEWGWPEEAVEVKLPVTNNDILGYIVQRLRNVVDPPITEPSSSLFPHFILKACVLGKFCSGKTTCLSKIAEAHGIYVLSTDTLIEEALNAHKNGEKVSLMILFYSVLYYTQWCVSLLSTQSGYHHFFFHLFPDLENQEENRAGNATVSRAIQGAAVEKELRKGNTIPNELLVDIIVEAISQLPSQSGWILDGFPFDIAQAHLLEKALGGDVSLEKEVVNSSKNLAKDPNPPKPPPPPAPVLDLVLLLDIPDEHAISRGYTKMDLDYAPRTSQHADKNVYLAQIGHRITAFQDTWPKLEKWFGEKQNILVRVDADVDVQELYSRVESILHQEIPEYLCSYWDTLCDSYVDGVKTVMQELRLQRSVINHHLFNIREHYKHYLGRPDLKQELVSQWQKNFNSIPDDMKEDEDTKEELHLRLDELRERLWDITDKRKEQDEQERASLMSDGWLEEHIVVLVNHHSILTQVELNRFQETLCILRVYYLSMCGQMLPKPLSTFFYDAVKARIALVKAHGLVMVQSLQSTVEEIFGNMEKWLHERYLAEMKSIDQLTEVVHHHIETGAKLKNELVLCSDFYLNGDCRVVASPLPPPRPPPLEKPMRSTPTIAQLELLYQQLYSISPSGANWRDNLLKDIITTNMGKDTLPEPWMDKSESQVQKLLDYELVDWRRFLLSAALPWPFPLLSQLLDVLQQFKAADTGDTGYINEENYLRTELWFSTESVQTVPEDPSEPVPYVRLANLRKFFFHMFADHSFSPSRLDYVSMLKYFAADPNPTQGFIRALSVVLGQKLTHFSLKENADLSSSELDYKEEGALSASSILEDEQEVSIPALLSVICHKITKMEDKSHVPSGSPNQKEHTAVWMPMRAKTEHLVNLINKNYN
uniref:Calponin-homology (CH) domain-containing protein n=1 Tax=Astatotilapia calliptera TaxID=8154 RepID=A0A3P8PNK1_ASTCA